MPVSTETKIVRLFHFPYLRKPHVHYSGLSNHSTLAVLSQKLLHHCFQFKYSPLRPLCPVEKRRKDGFLISGPSVGPIVFGEDPTQGTLGRYLASAEHILFVCMLKE